MFNFRIELTGVVSFIPNQGWQEDGGPTSLLAVLPDGTPVGVDHQKKTGVDGRPLESHYGILKFGLGNLKGAPSVAAPGDLGVLALDSRDIYFGFEFEEGNRTPLRAPWEIADLDMNVREIIGLDHVGLEHLARVAEVIPGAQVDQQNFAASPPITTLSRVFFDTGVVTGCKPLETLWSFKCPGARPDMTTPRELIQRISIDVLGVTAAKLYAWNFDRLQRDQVSPSPLRKTEAVLDERPELAMPETLFAQQRETGDWKPLRSWDNADLVMELGPSADQLGDDAVTPWVTTTILNICDENPLEFPAEATASSGDKDFRLHYQLLSSADKAALSEQFIDFNALYPLPFGGAMGIRGGDCMPGGWPSP